MHNYYFENENSVFELFESLVTTRAQREIFSSKLHFIYTTRWVYPSCSGIQYFILEIYNLCENEKVEIGLLCLFALDVFMISFQIFWKQIFVYIRINLKTLCSLELIITSSP